MKLLATLVVIIVYVEILSYNVDSFIVKDLKNSLMSFKSYN